ncbi:MAG: arginase family protein [Solirubrobacterales bacterium]
MATPAAPWTLLGAPLDSSGTGRGEERAPEALRAAGLAERLGLRDVGDVVPPLRDPVRDRATGVIAAEQLTAASETLRDAVAGVIRAGERPFVLGGDCSLLPGALAGARIATGPLGLWMIDGHPDALDGERSPTGEAADMDLAMVLGHGAPALTELAGTAPMVDPEHVALVGHRPAGLAPEVAAEIAAIPAGVAQTTAPDLRREGASAVAQRILAVADRPAWLHLDVDALDAAELPAVTYAQPQGLRWGEVVELISPLLASSRLAGVSLADLDPDHEQGAECARAVVEALGSAWTQPAQA